MPASKAASRKQKAAGAARKKTASRKASAGSKATGKKRKVSPNKARAASASTGRSASRKKSSRKTASRKAGRATTSSSRKSAAHKASRKKVTATKTSSRKTAGKAGKKVSKKTTSRKAAAPKATSRKQSSAPATARQSKPATVVPTKRRSRQDVLSGPIHGIKPYVPKRGEEYMSPQQLAHFEAILRSWKLELMNEVDRTVHHMQDEAANFPDPNDRATQESEFGLELRTRDRERKLLRKIDSALQRIEDGTYGYCDETGEEIGLKRLEARPVATLCLEAQERREMAERQFRDRDDRYR